MLRRLINCCIIIIIIKADDTQSSIIFSVTTKLHYFQTDDYRLIKIFRVKEKLDVKISANFHRLTVIGLTQLNIQ